LPAFPHPAIPARISREAERAALAADDEIRAAETRAETDTVEREPAD